MLKRYFDDVIFFIVSKFKHNNQQKFELETKNQDEWPFVVLFMQVQIPKRGGGEECQLDWIIKNGI